jgi:hypothetical protein
MWLIFRFQVLDTLKMILVLQIVKLETPIRNASRRQLGSSSTIAEFQAASPRHGEILNGLDLG